MTLLKDGVQLNLSTGLILAGIIFCASLIGGWVTQGKDIATLNGTVQAFSIDQKEQDKKITLNSERTAILENNQRTTKEDISEIKNDLKKIREDQLAYYRSRGFNPPNGKK